MSVRHIVVALLCVLLSCSSLQTHLKFGKVLVERAHEAVAKKRNEILQLKPDDLASWDIVVGDTIEEDPSLELVLRGNGKLDAEDIQGDWRRCKLRLTKSLGAEDIKWGLNILRILGCRNTLVLDLAVVEYSTFHTLPASVWRALRTTKQEVSEVNTNWGAKWHEVSDLKPAINSFSEELKRLHHVKFGDIYRHILENPEPNKFSLNELRQSLPDKNHFDLSIPSIFQIYSASNEHVKACLFARSIFALTTSSWFLINHRELALMMRTVSMSTWVSPTWKLPVIKFPESMEQIAHNNNLNDFIVSLPHKSQPGARAELYVLFYRDNVFACQTMDGALCERQNSFYGLFLNAYSESPGDCTLNRLFPSTQVLNAVSGSQLITLWHALAKIHGCKRSHLHDASEVYCDGLKLKSRAYLPLLGSNKDFKLTVYSAASMGGYVPVDDENPNILSDYRAAMEKYRNFKLYDMVAKMMDLQEPDDTPYKFFSALQYLDIEEETTLSQFVNKAKQACPLDNNSLSFCQLMQYFVDIEHIYGSEIFGEEIHWFISSATHWVADL